MNFANPKKKVDNKYFVKEESCSVHANRLRDMVNYRGRGIFHEVSY